MTERKSNRTLGHAQPQTSQQSALASTRRESNRPAVAPAGERVTLVLSDGPAVARTGAANIYELAQPISLSCDADPAGRIARTVCTASTPDGSGHPLDVTPTGEGWAAELRPSSPGTWWYAFDAYDADDDLLATGEKHLVVRNRRVPR